LEFLLVETRGGRWTFPKGNAEPGLTSAQAAALEAFEEAGVHGRIEELSFATYVQRKRGRDGRSAGVELTFTAHLCQVLWLDQPQEAGRNPTWFTPEQTKRRLCEGRSGSFASELVRMVDRAIKRIEQLGTKPSLLQLPRPRHARPQNKTFTKLKSLARVHGQRF
jgi:ADP-ribose pyrophosphatase YjhB (NUDIX family)